MFFVANHEGNVTCLTEEGHILATPTSMSKADIREHDLILLDRFGRKISGARKPFSELPMHLVIYQTRPDVRAVVHAHPPYSTAFSSVGQQIEVFFLPEFIVSIGGKVPLVPFAIPGSETLNNNIRQFLNDFDVLLLENHGVLAYGRDLTEALLRVEHCEEAAKVLFLVRQLGTPKSIPSSQIDLLLDTRTKAGLGPIGRARKLR